MANLSLPSLHILLMIVIVKPSGGVNCRFERYHYPSDVLMNRKNYDQVIERTFSADLWPGMFLCKNEITFLKKKYIYM